MANKIDLLKHVTRDEDIIGVALLNTITRFYSGNDLEKFFERIGYKDGNTEVEAHLVIGGEIMDISGTFKEFEKQITAMITDRAKELLKQQAEDLQNKLYSIGEAIDSLVASHNIEIDD